MSCQVAVEDIIADGRLRLAVQPVFDETQLAAALQVLHSLPHPYDFDVTQSVMFGLGSHAHADQRTVCHGHVTMSLANGKCIFCEGPLNTMLDACHSHRCMGDASVILTDL